MEEQRLKAAFKRIGQSKIIMKQSEHFTPLSLPIKVDNMRATMSNESLHKRIEEMQIKAAKSF